MTELKEIPNIPPDSLSLFHDDHFIGSGYVYRSRDNRLGVEEIKFNTPKTQTLDPFYYNKPIENPTDPFKPPAEFVRDGKPRVGYYPLTLVEQALRPPSHLYEVDDALFCAVNRGTDEQPKWETRYFPRKSIDPQVWNQAFDILEKTKPIEIIASTGLSLKQFATQDAEEIFALIDRNREHLSQFGDETAEKYPTLESVRESIGHPKNPKRLRFAIRNKEGQFVGSINITPDEENQRVAEIGYYLGSEFQRQGYMAKAVEMLTDYGFETLAYKTIYGDVTKGNTASSSVLLNAGYKETGRLDGKIRYSKNKEQNGSQLNTFDFEGKTQ